MLPDFYMNETYLVSMPKCTKISFSIPGFVDDL